MSTTRKILIGAGVAVAIVVVYLWVRSRAAAHAAAAIGSSSILPRDKSCAELTARLAGGQPPRGAALLDYVANLREAKARGCL